MSVLPNPTCRPSGIKVDDRGGFTVKESLIAIVVALLFVVLVTYDDLNLRTPLSLKTCIANMKTIHQAATLAIMEDPNIPDLTVQALVDKKLLAKAPVCPNLPADRPGDGEYLLVDKMGQPIDVTCVNHAHPDLGHGSFLTLKAKYLDQP